MHGRRDLCDKPATMRVRASVNGRTQNMELCDAHYRPEYGARELRRQIRTLVETRLARVMLGGEVAQGDTVRIGWDATAEQVRIEAEAKAASGGCGGGRPHA